MLSPEEGPPEAVLNVGNLAEARAIEPAEADDDAPTPFALPWRLLSQPNRQDHAEKTSTRGAFWPATQEQPAIDEAFFATRWHLTGDRLGKSPIRGAFLPTLEAKNLVNAPNRCTNEAKSLDDAAERFMIEAKLLR